MHYVSSVLTVLLINFGLKVKPNFGLKLKLRANFGLKLEFTFAY